MHFSLDMGDLTAEQEATGERLGATLGNAHPEWDITWTPGLTWNGQEFRGSFHIVGTVEAEATHEALADALVEAVVPAVVEAQAADLPFEVKTWPGGV